MKKKYLFLLLFLPFLSLGQDTTYAVHGNKLVETITHRVSGVDAPKGRNYVGQSRYWFEKPGTLILESESFYGDNIIGIFWLHKRWYRDTYQIGKDRVVLTNSELLSDTPKYIGNIALLILFFAISLLSYVFDGKDDLRRYWLDAKRPKLYPHLAVYMRVGALGALYLLTALLVHVYGGDKIFPFLVTSIISAISISVLIVRCHKVRQDDQLQFG